MDITAYDPKTGEMVFHAAFSDPSTRPAIPEGLAIVEGERAEPSAHWIDKGTRRDREAVKATLSAELFSPGVRSVILTGAPAGAWVRIRPDARMAVDRELVRASAAGEVAYTPPVAGPYVAEFIGRYKAEPFAFLAETAAAHVEAEALRIEADRELTEVVAIKRRSRRGLALKRVEAIDYANLGRTALDKMTAAERALRFPFITEDAAAMGDDFHTAAARVTAETAERVLRLAKVEAMAAKAMRALEEPGTTAPAAVEKVRRARAIKLPKLSLDL